MNDCDKNGLILHLWERDSSASASCFARPGRLHDQRSGGRTVAISDRSIGSLRQRWHLEEEEKQVEESLAVESSPPLSTSATSDPPPTTNYRAGAAEFFNRYVLE
ncbi:hypothetical protein MUK42_34206 [Musa troglodytarum]|uniref:Uncharacterized protein n=1 Tax=Musa troglodytarum TaxID=320322 RepID=A0A9E7ED74_9LILI|nr:hypothetical protein MUK42_34206 [Musa troglodytarum]URD73787.1 hypothetical protein MUK42_34206 [Musa troglodytarum]URD73788.1 hypothetical protein MUK42_34206 [Musa troglodytarum]